MSYDDPDFQIRREGFGGESGGAATTEYCKFRSFQKMRLKAVHAVVTTAGTATTHALNIYHGTTSIGAISIGTSPAGSIASSGVLNEVCAALDQVSVKTGPDVVGKNHVIYEYEVTPDAVQS